MLSSVPGLNKAMYDISNRTEKIRVLDKIHSDISYSAAGHEFNINESTLHII